MEPLEVRSLEHWRQWLAQHHDSEREVWLVFTKAHAGGPAFSYDDAVCEALCVGWVDSLIKRLDDQTYARKFTPRKPGSNWSAANKKRVIRLVQQGRMRPEGMALVDFPLEQPVEERPKLSDDPDEVLTWDLIAQLRAAPRAWKHLMALPPSHRRNYLAWIASAKKPETRTRRMDETIDRLLHGQPLGMK